MNSDDPVVQFLEKEFHGVHRHIEYAINLVSQRLEQRMSDLSSQVESDTSALDADLGQISARLDAAQADQLTQADADALHAVRTKADALLSASPVQPTATGSTSGDVPATNPTDASSAGAPSTGDQTAPSGSDQTTSGDTTGVTSGTDTAATGDTTTQPGA